MAKSGQNAVVNIDSTPVNGLNDATITVNGEVIDVTTFASGGWIEKIQGLKSAELSLAGFTESADAGQTAVNSAILAGTIVTMETLLDGVTGWTGDFLVTSIEQGATPSGEITYSASMESTGAITQV